jgi:hypothetical protein
MYALRLLMCSQHLGGDFSPAQPKSRVELQHIIATRATRSLFGRIADMRDRRLPSNHRGDQIACCETPRITGSRLRRPRRAASWAPVGLHRYLRRARLRAPRGGGRLCAAFRYAGAENAWSGSATAHNRKQHIEAEVLWSRGNAATVPAEEHASRRAKHPHPVRLRQSHRRSEAAGGRPRPQLWLVWG